PVGSEEPINDRSLPEQEALDAALELAVQAVLQLGTPSDRRWIEYLANDPNTIQPVRQAIAHAMPQPREATQARATTTAADAGTEPGVPPVRVTREMIQDAFAPVRDEMIRCLDNSPSRPNQLRLSFRYDSTGTISDLAVAPAEYSACITPIAS